MRCPGSADKLVLSSPGAQQPRPGRAAGELHGRWISQRAAELAKPRAPEMVWGQMCLFFFFPFISTLRGWGFSELGVSEVMFRQGRGEHLGSWHPV